APPPPHIAVSVAEPADPERGRDLEERALAPHGQSGDLVERALEPRLVRPRSVHADALAEVDEVRRGEGSRAHADGTQHALDQRAHGTLAVGAGDVDRAEAALGVLQRFEQRERTLEPQLVSPALL